MRYLKIKNFEKFQHYKGRRPLWIKLYNALLDDFAYARLQDASKAHLVGLWLLASRTDNLIPYDLPFIAQTIRATTALDVDELVSSGFIGVYDDASGLLAECLQVATLEKRREEKKQTGASAPVRAVKPSPDVDVVMAHYRQLHPKKRPDEKAVKSVIRALQTYSPEELCEAVSGNAADEWCRKSGNQGLPYLLRDNATIDKYRAQSEHAKPSIAVVDGWFATA